MSQLYTKPSKNQYKRKFRFLALFCAFNLLFNTIILPTATYAVTSGPSQPEISSFASIDTSNMVDLFSGDFSYNIPLLELPGPNGGYPFNLVYNSGVSGEQEASWVGLGWNLTPGSIQRQMRGIPDEFNGKDNDLTTTDGDDIITKTTDMKNDDTFGLTVDTKIEFLGFDKPKGAEPQDTISLGALSIPLTIYYNTYKGLGYTLGINPSLNLPSNSSLSLNPGINFSLDNKDGVSITPSLGLQTGVKQKRDIFNLGVSYNSRVGLTNLGLNYNSSSNAKLAKRMNANVNLYNQGRVPSSETPMRTINLSGSANFGIPAGLIFAHIKPQIFFNSQWSVKDAQRISAYGYMYSQNVSDEGMMDINRDKESPIFKESVSLSIPEATYDIYSVSGHGLQGAFRPYRSDIGIYGNPKVVSITEGAEVGLDFGTIGVATHIGVDVGVNMGATKSTKWTNRQNKVRANNGNNGYKHTKVGDNGNNPLHEPFYFKFTSDRTTVQENELAYIGDATYSNQTPNLKPVRIALGGKSREDFGQDDANFKIRINTVPALPKLETQNEQGTSTVANITSPYHPTKERESRNTLIQQFTNEELKSMRLGKVTYINDLGTVTPYSRTTHPKHHIGAFVVTKPDGARYIYALPAYNKKHIERQVTVKGNELDSCKNTVDYNGREVNDDTYKVQGTDMYSSKTEISPYAYAHLLTAIVGDDYVDTDEIEGPSDGDIGYWVKFTYKLHDTDYHWRTPFEGVNFSPGFLNTKLDDKGSYMYGEKEIYYVASAETKSHIVKFKTSARADGRGAKEQFQNKLPFDALDQNANLGGNQLKLEEVKLYVKSALVANPSVAPLKTVKLDYAGYADELCQKIVNRKKEGTTGKTGGKLTLKKVQFLYQNSMRGSYNDYTFHYANNPDYEPLQVDRWGSYTTAFGVDNCKYQHFPYVDQSAAYDANRNKDASAWLLSSIDLPSGATINVNYESDDYAYVQNKVAMQMTSIDAVGDISDFRSGNNKLNKLNNTGENHKVFFKLEQPIAKPSGTPTEITEFEKKQVNRYIDATKQIFFKSKIQLQNPDKGRGFPEFITGYADIKEEQRGLISKEPTDTHYTHGYLTVKAVEKGDKGYHPFSVAAWQHIKGKQPKLLLPNAPGFGESSGGFKEIMRNVATLAGIVPALKQMFKGYYEYMFDKNWGREMDLENSWIRLNSADRIKYGGGVRVKRIILNDKWTKTGGASYYGQQYDYRMEENGEVISSGVAAYEPQIGGEENPLRYGEAYEQKLLLATDNQYFLEHPINEGLYPSAQVGYRKVTVKSLAAANLANEELGEATASFIDAGFHATTGVTVHEFYTAKEFPVIVDRTTINRVPFGFWLPLLIGQITMTGLTASQGFSVETNDMHGKPKQVTHYRQKQDGSLIESPVSWTKYNYKKVDRGNVNKGGEAAFGVDNRVQVLVKDDGTKEGIIKEYRLLGLEREFVVDMQQQTSWSGNVSVDFNIELKVVPVFPFIVPIPGVAPFIGASFTNTRTVTTNKIVSRSGILESVEAYDGTATLKTENLLWDAQTAEVLLTSVNNSFDDKIYNYSIPARFHYEKTKAAYHNADFQTTVTKSSGLVTRLDGFNYLVKLSDPQNINAKQHLQEGDEIIAEFTLQNGLFPAQVKYVTISKKHENGDCELFMRNANLLVPQLIDKINIKVIRSGSRNLLGAKVGAITALLDPTDSANRTKTECEKELIFPSDCDTDTTGLANLSISWTATSNITIAQTPREVEVIPAGGTQTYTYIWNIYDANNVVVRTLQSYTRRIPISNDPSNPLSGNHTITCTITDTQNRTATSIPRNIIFN